MGTVTIVVASQEESEVELMLIAGHSQFSFSVILTDSVPIGQHY